MQRSATRVPQLMGSLYLGSTTVGSRGQVVVPARARRTLGLKAGDQLVAFLHHGRVLGLVKAEVLERFLGQLTRELTSLQR